MQVLLIECYTFCPCASASRAHGGGRQGAADAGACCQGAACRDNTRASQPWQACSDLQAFGSPGDRERSVLASLTNSHLTPPNSLPMSAGVGGSAEEEEGRAAGAGPCTQTLERVYDRRRWRARFGRRRRWCWRARRPSGRRRTRRRAGARCCSAGWRPCCSPAGARRPRARASRRCRTRSAPTRLQVHRGTVSTQRPVVHWACKGCGGDGGAEQYNKPVACTRRSCKVITSRSCTPGAWQLEVPSNSLEQCAGGGAGGAGARDVCGGDGAAAGAAACAGVAHASGPCQEPAGLLLLRVLPVPVRAAGGRSVSVNPSGPGRVGGSS